MVGLIVWLVIGGVVGWLASLVMRTDAQQGIFLNVIVGIVGAFIGGLLFGPNINSGVVTPASVPYCLTAASRFSGLLNHSNDSSTASA